MINELVGCMNNQRKTQIKIALVDNLNLLVQQSFIRNTFLIIKNNNQVVSLSKVQIESLKGAKIIVIYENLG